MHRLTNVDEMVTTFGVDRLAVTRELASAIRRSDVDVFEVYGLIRGRRFVARRDTTTGEEWTMRQEDHPTRANWVTRG